MVKIIPADCAGTMDFKIEYICPVWNKKDLLLSWEQEISENSS